jgi:hypothetical protein
MLTPCLNGVKNRRYERRQDDLDSEWIISYLNTVKTGGDVPNRPLKGDFPMTSASVFLQDAADRAGSALLLALSVVTAVGVISFV